MTSRYHPDVIWGPFVLALVLGLVISAGLYFAYLWPGVEPEDLEDLDDPANPAPEVPDAPKVPNAPKVPKVPKMPKMPKMRDA